MPDVTPEEREAVYLEGKTRREAPGKYRRKALLGDPTCRGCSDMSRPRGLPPLFAV